MGVLELLMNEMIGSPGDPLGVVMGRLVGGGDGGASGESGVPALLTSFDHAGLGHIAQSWVGPGPNLPVTADQLHKALGEKRVGELARQSGLPVRDILPMVAEHLPAVIERLSREGHLPAGISRH